MATLSRRERLESFAELHDLWVVELAAGEMLLVAEEHVIMVGVRPLPNSTPFWTRTHPI